MGGSAASVAYLILAVFLFGFAIGAVLGVSRGSRLEDRLYSLSGQAPSAVARGARRLNGYSGSGRRFLPRGRGQ